MPLNDEVQEALCAAMDQERPNPSAPPGPLTTRLRPGGGVGPLRPTRASINVSNDSDIVTKYYFIMKGFRILEATYESVKLKLADSEERLRSKEEKARSDEASLLERISQLEDQVYSREIAYTELEVQAKEKIQIDAYTHAAEVSRLEERVQASELANSELAEKLDQCESALKDRESDFNSLSETVQRSVTCGICQFIATRPCSTDCRHIFCAMCLISWWQTKQETSCPTCRTISQFPPVRDSIQGLVSLARAQAGEEETSDSFQADIFDAFFPSKVLKVLKSGARRRPTTPIEIIDD